MCAVKLFHDLSSNVDHTPVSEWDQMSAECPIIAARHNGGEFLSSHQSLLLCQCSMNMKKSDPPIFILLEYKTEKSTQTFHLKINQQIFGLLIISVRRNFHSLVNLHAASDYSSEYKWWKWSKEKRVELFLTLVKFSR